MFDEIEDLEIPELGEMTMNDVDEEEEGTGEGLNRIYVESIRRRQLLESWLEDVVRSEVEDDLRNLASSSSPSSPSSSSSTGAARIFTLLSGHQISRACSSALDSKDLRLATLLAQAGGDDEFREDVYLQLSKWREYRVDSFISEEHRRVYEVLCGNVGISEGRKNGGGVGIEERSEEVNVSEGVGWKRAFGLQLWYGTFGSEVSEAVQRYEASLSSTKVAPPQPDYILSSSSSSSTPTTTWSSPNTSPTSPLYHFLKLFTSPTHSLESVLLPQNFGPSPLDYRLSWHLYILFSRVLRRRDFEDRVVVGADGDGDGDGEEEGVEGNSVRADAVTEAYATQLERSGLWEWSVFVLLHLELVEQYVFFPLFSLTFWHSVCNSLFLLPFSAVEPKQSRTY